MGAAARAFVGHDLWAGKIQLVRPTLAQASILVDASAPYLRLAGIVADRPDRRQDVEAGRISLVDAALSVRPRALPNALDMTWRAASAGQRELFARENAAELWDVFDAVTS